MEERDLSTLNKNCWHSTHGKFCRVWLGSFPNFWAEPGDKVNTESQVDFTFSLTFSNDAGDTTEKQTRKTSVCG